MEIVALQEDQLDEAADLLLSAFQGEAFTAAFLDLGRERIRRIYHRLVKTRYTLYLKAGHPVFSATEDGRIIGLVVLTSPHVAIPKWSWFRSWFSFLCLSFPSWLALLPRVIRSIGLVAAMRRPRRLSGAHYTLEAIAVRPSHQGKGVGRLLLEQVERCRLADNSSSGVYLYTGDERNRRIYERAGYQLLETKKTDSIISYHLFRTSAQQS